MNHLAAGDASPIFGVIGTGGISIVLTLLLIAGIKGKGDLKLNRFGAYAVGFVAGTFYAIAGVFWASASTASGSVMKSVTEGTTMGTVGAGAVAISVLVILYGFKIWPSVGGMLGVFSATVFGTAGGIWAVPASLVMGPIAGVLGLT